MKLGNAVSVIDRELSETEAMHEGFLPQEVLTYTDQLVDAYLYLIFITRIASPSRSVTPFVTRIAQSCLMKP